MSLKLQGFNAVQDSIPTTVTTTTAPAQPQTPTVASFKGDNDSSKGNSLGFLWPTGLGAAGGAGGYFLLKSPLSQDKFQSTIANGEEIKLKDGQTLTAEEAKLVEDAKALKGSTAPAVTNPSTSTTTTSTAKESEALKTAKEAVAKADIAHNHAAQELKEGNAHLTDATDIRTALAEASVAGPLDIDKDKGETIDGLKKKRTELEQDLKQLKDDIKGDALKQDPGLKAAKEKDIARITKEIETIDRKTMSPEELRLQAAINKAQKMVEEAEARQKEINEAQDKAEKQARQTVKDAEAEMEKFTDSDEYKKVTSDQKAEALKPYEEKLNSAKANKETVFTETHYQRNRATSRLEARKSLLGMVNKDGVTPEAVKTATSNIDVAAKAARQAITTDDGKPGKLAEAVDTAKKGIHDSEAVLYKAEGSEASTQADMAKIKARAEARISKSSVVTSSVKTEGEGGSAFAEAVEKAYKAIGGKLAEGRSTKAGLIGAAIGVGVGLAAMFALGHKSNSDQA